MKRFGFFIIALIFSYSFVHGQKTIKEDVFTNHNIIYGTAALGGLWGTLNLNYERQLTTTSSQLFKTVGLRFGGGYWSTWGSTGSHFILTPVFISGTGKHHFESSIGVALLYDKISYDIGVSNAMYFDETIPSRAEYMDLYPSGTLGYRFQKPDGWFVFRTGAGFPDVVYLSVGVAF